MNRRLQMIALGAVAMLTGVCAAQSTEYELSADGGWDTVSTPEPGSDAELMARMRRHLADADAATVRREMDAWLEDPANNRSPQRPQALLLRGDSLVLLDREFTALYDYEDIIRSHSQSAEFYTAIERELDIADLYVNGLKLRAFGVRYGDPEPIVREVFIRTGERVPGSVLAERALISMADYYYARRDMALARDSYDVYLLNFPEGPNAVHARARRIFTDIARFKGPKYDASGLIDAGVRVRRFLNRHPTEAREVGVDSALLTRIDESIAAQLLDTANWYLTQNDWPSARYTLGRLLREHPGSVAAIRAREMLDARGESVEPEANEEEAPSDDASDEGTP